MERLTEWVGSGPDRKAIARQDCGDIGDKDCVARLAAYEDTGLTPEEINAIKGEIEFDQMKGLKKLLQAERAGLLVVLPCKVGDRLYVVGHGLECIHTDTVEGIIFREDEVEIEVLWEDYSYSSGEFGKTVFLTRQEAEAALKAAKTAKEEI